MSSASGPVTKDQVLQALNALYQGTDNVARVQAGNWLEMFQKTVSLVLLFLHQISCQRILSSLPLERARILSIPQYPCSCSHFTLPFIDVPG